MFVGYVDQIMEDRSRGSWGVGVYYIQAWIVIFQCKQREPRNRCYKYGRMGIGSLPPLALNPARFFMKEGKECRSSYKLADKIKRVADPWFQAS
jgi:hypothetical protein